MGYLLIIFIIIYILELKQTDYTQVWVTGFSTLAVIIPAVLAYLQSRKTAQKVEVLTSNVEGSNVKVAELAKNIDGAMNEIKTVIGEKNLAEGKLAGIAEERERPPAIISDPQQVKDALNGPEVRKQIDNIEEIVNGTLTTSKQIEKQAAEVAKDLSMAHKRADEVVNEEHGAAADAAAKQTKKEKQKEAEDLKK